MTPSPWLRRLVLFGAMLVTIVSGMGWSTYWSPTFTALTNKISPNSWTDAPPSVLGKRSDLDVLGSTIPWNTGDRPIPASYVSAPDGTLPALLSLASVVAVAEKSGMKPGYRIAFPAMSSFPRRR